MTAVKDFLMLAPLDTSETEILSGPPDAENQVFAGGATYNTGDQVWHAGHAYWSLVDSNTGNTPPSAQWLDQGEVDQGAAAYGAGTTYAENDYAVYEGALWQSAQSSNTGNTPSGAGTEWTRIGATERRKAFDGFLQEAASLSGGLKYVLQYTEIVTEIAILRAAGVSVNVTVTDATEGEVYNQDFALQDDSGIADAWDYCFGPFIFIDTVVVADLPPYAGAEIAITFLGDGDLSVSQILVGSGLRLGTVKVGSGVGIESYTLKDRDSFNRSIVVPRPYSDTVDFDLAIPASEVGYVKRRLAEREALATLYFQVGGAALGTIVYGFFQEFDILHTNVAFADCVLEIEGLG